MPDLLELLERFNRKERFFLMRHALDNFRLSCDFRKQLGDEIGLEIPEDTVVAMDYHLDWLTAALYVHNSVDGRRFFENPEQQIVKGNQEDIDLLVAFTDGAQYHIVLVEAKGGATGWTNKQMKSKADRLTLIFGSEGKHYSGVEPHFCLTSPRCPKQLNVSEWPGWMSKDDQSYYWIKLKFPKDRIRVTRCDDEEMPSAKGNHFKIISA
jgi:hypothetical protein